MQPRCAHITTSPMLAKLDVSDRRRDQIKAFNKPFPHEAYRVGLAAKWPPLKRTLAKRAMEKKLIGTFEYQENQLIVDVIILNTKRTSVVFQQGRARLYKGKVLQPSSISVVTVSR
ncbi:hypothetical protein SPFM9_00153 [Salmonella phage SPFM9]|nr:hypothetical protein SPFM9_00153 [Salmonella phage SPFM9]